MPLECFFAVEDWYYVFDFFSSQCSIEEHRYTTPDDRESIADDPESDETREYGIDPPDPEEFREDEGDEDSSIHHEIGGVVECVGSDEERVMDSTNTKEIPHDESCPNEGTDHRGEFDPCDGRCLFRDIIHHSLITEKYPSREDDETLEYRSKSLNFPESISVFLSLSLLRYSERECIHSWDEHIHKWVKCWSEDREWSWEYPDDRLHDREDERYNESEIDTKWWRRRNFNHAFSLSFSDRKANSLWK